MKNSLNLRTLRVGLISILFLAIFSTSALALNPSRTYKQKPEAYNMTYEESKVKTNDGQAELNVWDFPSTAAGATKLILLLHSGEGNMADYLKRVEMLRSEYTVVVFDYRGFGESSDFEIDPNMYMYPHFQDDVETMIDYCRKKYVSTFNIYGWGIGGGLALGIGYRRVEITKIIADTPFLSIEDLEERFGSWDEPMEVPFAGFEVRNEPIKSVLDASGKNLQSVQLIIGSNDLLFNLNDMKNLQSKSKFIDPNVYVVVNPNRKDNFRANQAAYYKVISDFLR